MTTRRQFLKRAVALSAAAAATPLHTFARTKATEPVAVKGEIGVTTGSFMDHITFAPAAGKQRMLDLPKIMRNELDMRVLDLMSRTLESFEPAYLEKLRAEAEANRCIITNLKLNQKGLDMASPDAEQRREALKVYKESIDAAHLLGCRWVRPGAGSGAGTDRDRLIAAYRELIDYGAPKEISVLIENTGWVSRNADAIPEVIRRVGEGLHASPDTGNWDDAVRDEGLRRAYPLAATTDFKAFMLEPDGSHPRYDLKRCFEIGWDAGFRGPWCIEHFHDTLPGLLKGFATVRDRLRGWIREKSG